MTCGCPIQFSAFFGDVLKRMIRKVGLDIPDQKKAKIPAIDQLLTMLTGTQCMLELIEAQKSRYEWIWETPRKRERERRLGLLKH